MIGISKGRLMHFLLMLLLKGVKDGLLADAASR